MTDDARQQRRRRKAELAFRALTAQGNPKKAADHLGIAESTLRKRITDYLLLNGFDTVAQAAYWLDRDRISA